MSGRAEYNRILSIVREKNPEIAYRNTQKISGYLRRNGLNPNSENDMYLAKRAYNLVPTESDRSTEIHETTALRGYAKSYTVNIDYDSDPLKQENRLKIKRQLNQNITEMRGIKFVETLKVSFTKESNGQEITKTAFFNSKPQIAMNNISMSESLEISREQILNFIARCISEGSGWQIDKIIGHFINLTPYQPLNASSYIELPKELKNPKKGLINIQNEDDECFRWCHVRHINSQNKNAQRVKKVDREIAKNLDYTGIEFPVKLKQINKIEKQNNIRINVFGYEKEIEYPLYVSKEKFEDHMELLLITGDKNNHYVLIKDFNRFMYNKTQHKEKKHFCYHCLQCFSSKRVLDKHIDNCITINGIQGIEMPEKGSTVKFENYHKQQPVPFVIYADFEAITEKIECDETASSESYTRAYQ